MTDFNEKLSQIKVEYKENEPLAQWTTFKIGGPAKYFCVAETLEQMAALIKICQKEKMPYLILGGGSNILVNDQGFAGLVIKNNLNYIKKYNVESRLRLATAGDPASAKATAGEVEIGAGVNLSKAVGDTLGAGLTGLEWALGIPGTVGGAVHNNAGAYGGEMSQSVKEVKILHEGKIKNLKNKDCDFGYRESVFKKEKNQDIILSLALELKKGDVAVAKAKMKEIASKRKDKVPIEPSAGSFFKNVLVSSQEAAELKNKFSEIPAEFLEWKKIPAGWLIEQCGLKGKTIGGAQVSEKHAGFIINAGGATAENVAMLASIIKQKVRAKFNLQLMEEIEYIGF